MAIFMYSNVVIRLHGVNGGNFSPTHQLGVVSLQVHASLADWSEKVYILLMVFEYDEVKSRSNTLKHGVDFKEIQELWDDERYVHVPARYAEESRFLVVGKFKDKIWSCVITYRDGTVRIISARRPRRDEEELYERE